MNGESETKIMDREQLGQQIRSGAHRLEMITKCDNKGDNRGMEEYTSLLDLLNEWHGRGFETVLYIQWAQQIIERYKYWLKGKEKIVYKTYDSVSMPMDTDIFSIIRKRRSIRFWRQETVPQEKIQKIIEAASYAPSAFNRMTWRFYVVENELEAMVDGDTSNESMIRKAPVRIYVGIDERLYEEKFAPALDAGLAAQNMMLAAEAMNIGTCIIYQCEIINHEKLRERLNIPEYIQIYFVLLAGFPNEVPSVPERVGVNEIAYFYEPGRVKESFLS